MAGHCSSHSDAVYVTCPQCKENLIQCRYYQFNLCKKKVQKHTVFAPKERCLFCTWERNMSRNIITTRIVYQGFNPKRRRRSKGKKKSGISGQGSHVADKGKGDVYSFICCRCHHVCRKGDTGKIALTAWELLSTKGNDVAQVVCPDCMIK